MARPEFTPLAIARSVISIFVPSLLTRLLVCLYGPIFTMEGHFHHPRVSPWTEPDSSPLQVGGARLPIPAGARHYGRIQPSRTLSTDLSALMEQATCTSRATGRPAPQTSITI